MHTNNAAWLLVLQLAHQALQHAD